MKRFQSLIQDKTQLKQGRYIFKKGDKLKNLYVVRTGSYKCCSPTLDGRETINGFYLPGKILGLNAIADDIHPDSAQTLETSSVCEIPYGDLMSLCYQLPNLQQQYIKMLGNELLESQDIKLITSKNTADTRLATYLIGVSNRRKKRGYNCTDFQLSMTRIDLANYLCVANETLSRSFSRFKNEGLIVTKCKQIKLINLNMLKQLAGIKLTLQCRESA